MFQTEDIIREQMEELIKEYRNDPDLQDLIDSIQSDVSTELDVYYDLVVTFVVARMLWY